MDGWVWVGGWVCIMGEGTDATWPQSTGPCTSCSVVGAMWERVCVCVRARYGGGGQPPLALEELVRVLRALCVRVGV